MSKMELLIKEMENFPEYFLDQVLDFVCYLKVKQIKEKADITMISESSLKKDWLTREEDKAWENL